MGDVIATVTFIQGEVIARAPDGSERVLQIGDEIREGEVIITSAGGRVEFDFVDGGFYVMTEDEELTASIELAQDTAPTDDEAVTDDDVVAEVLEALEGDEDLLEVLEDPAAGPGGGDGAGGGRSFVQLARISELTGDLSFAFGQNEPGAFTGSEEELFTEVAEDETTPSTEPEPPAETPASGSISVLFEVGFATNLEIPDRPVLEAFAVEGGERDVGDDVRLAPRNPDSTGLEGSISGTTENVPAGNEVTIVITDSDGNTLEVDGPVTVQEDGSYAVDGIDLSSLVNGELTVDVSVADPNGDTQTDTTTGEIFDAPMADITFNVTASGFVDGEGSPDIVLNGSVSTESTLDQTITVTISGPEGFEDVSFDVVADANGFWEASEDDLNALDLEDGAEYTASVTFDDGRGEATGSSASGFDLPSVEIDYGLESEALLVDERFLDNGTAAGEGEPTDSGVIRIDSAGGFTSVSIAGQKVEFSTLANDLPSVGVISTEKGEVTLTNFEEVSDGVYDLTFDYLLTENSLEHSSEVPRDQISKDPIDVSVEVAGNTATSQIDVTIVDDVPVDNKDAEAALSVLVSEIDQNFVDSDGESVDAPKASGSFDADWGADGPADDDAIQFGIVGDESSLVGFAEAATELTIEGTYGSLVVTDDGEGSFSYTYTLKDDAGAAVLEAGSPQDVFTYVLTDGDGDTVDTNLTFDISAELLEFDGPRIEGLVGDGGDATVYEAFLEGGTRVGPDNGNTDNGSFNIIAAAGVASLAFAGGDTDAGTDFSASFDLGQLEDAAESEPLTVTTTKGVLSITGFTDNENGTYTVNYSYELTETADHPEQGRDELEKDVIDVTVTDNANRTAENSVDITIVDDVPEFEEGGIDDAALSAAEGSNFSGDLNLTIGADSEGASVQNVTLQENSAGFIEVQYTENGASKSTLLTSGGSKLQYEFDQDAQQLIAFKEGENSDDPVFTIDFDIESGDYTVNVIQELDAVATSFVDAKVPSKKGGGVALDLTLDGTDLTAQFTMLKGGNVNWSNQGIGGSNNLISDGDTLVANFDQVLTELSFTASRGQGNSQTAKWEIYRDGGKVGEGTGNSIDFASGFDEVRFLGHSDNQSNYRVNDFSGTYQDANLNYELPVDVTVVDGDGDLADSDFVIDFTPVGPDLAQEPAPDPLPIPEATVDVDREIDFETVTVPGSFENLGSDEPVGGSGDNFFDSQNPGVDSGFATLDFGADKAGQIVTVSWTHQAFGGWEDGETGRGGTEDMFEVFANDALLEKFNYYDPHNSDDTVFDPESPSFDVVLDENGKVELEFRVTSTHVDEIVNVSDISASLMAASFVYPVTLSGSIDEGSIETFLVDVEGGTLVQNGNPLTLNDDGFYELDGEDIADLQVRPLDGAESISVNTRAISDQGMESAWTSGSVDVQNLAASDNSSEASITLSEVEQEPVDATPDDAQFSLSGGGFFSGSKSTSDELLFEVPSDATGVLSFGVSVTSNSSLSWTLYRDGENEAIASGQGDFQSEDLPSGEYELEIDASISWGFLGSASASITDLELITILPPEQVPEAQAVTGNIITDLGPDGAPDVRPADAELQILDGDDFTPVNDDPVTVAGRFGSLEISGNGAYIYTPEANAENIGGVETFTYQLVQPNGNSAQAALTIQINDPSDSVNVLFGTDGGDTLEGGDGLDILVGGPGDDTLTGGDGDDIFRWNDGDQGAAGEAANDVVTDFSNGSNVLDLADLLRDADLGENNENLSDYLQASTDGEGNTVIKVSTAGGLGSEPASDADQIITLEGFEASVNNGADIVAQMIAEGQLKVDSESNG
ncbi:retention module-containing protein [Methylonatrum kenyense]|uniref:retention module-containing protein n=1 Tax=Methylonatrum kenyense TaxID=455253 RepID=UPI0024A6DAAB|nr:retention module-containing protein [Methylonatrum kenyense]